jgi:hypothetical protein
MRKLVIALFLASLCAPAVAQADARISAFYYPWYETAGHDGAFVHWSQRGHAPPDDIASAYYPARGLYSSADPLVVAAQMDEIRGAGIGELAVRLQRYCLERTGVDDIEQVARLDEVAVLELDGFDEAADPGADLDFLHRLEAAGELVPIGDGPLGRLRNGDWRRPGRGLRRGLLPAARQAGGEQHHQRRKATH